MSRTNNKRADDDLAALVAAATRVVGEATGVEQIEAFAAFGEHTSAKAYDGDVESVTTAASRGIGIRVIQGERQGFAHAASIDADIVAETLADARDNLAFVEADPYVGLAEDDGVAAVDLDLWSDRLESFGVDECIEMALRLEATATAADPRVTGVRTAAVSRGVGGGVLATSTGRLVTELGTSASMGVSLMASENDEVQTGSASASGRDAVDFDVDEVAALAAERAVRMFGATKPASARLTVLFEPQVAASLMGIVAGMFSAEAVIKGRTPFADRLGDAIASACFTLISDPTNLLSRAASAHDGEGLACRPNTIIDGGKANLFLHNAQTARQLKARSTGSAVRGTSSTPGVGASALTVVPGEGSFDDLVAGIDLGLVVRSLQGLHSGVNPTSGDFSVGATGQMIRGGTIAEPVREMTIASTIPRMLSDIVRVGADHEWLPGGTGAASIVIDDLSISGS